MKKQKTGFSEGRLSCINNPSKINAFIAYIGGTVNNVIWDFSGDKYFNCGLDEQLQSNNIQEIRCEIFKLNDIWEPGSKIIHKLINIKFYHLKQLQLTNNQIQSIEILSLMESPNLSELNINRNLITTVDKALNQCVFPNLHTLLIANNNIRQLNYLSRANFSSLEMIILESFPMNKTQNQSLNYLYKINSSNFLFLLAYGARIQKENIKKTLQSKFPNAKINCIPRIRMA